ncbi:putative inner membrane efflux protein [Serratia marcescens]|nr:putative inner membrane efflux protein [Serratia marcescens]
MEQLAERISKAVPEPESKEQLVLQQVGLVLELLPELTALHAQINKAA